MVLFGVPEATEIVIALCPFFTVSIIAFNQFHQHKETYIRQEHPF